MPRCDRGRGKAGVRSQAIRMFLGQEILNGDRPCTMERSQSYEPARGKPMVFCSSLVLLFVPKARRVHDAFCLGLDGTGISRRRDLRGAGGVGGAEESRSTPGWSSSRCEESVARGIGKVALLGMCFRKDSYTNACDRLAAFKPVVKASCAFLILGVNERGRSIFYP